MHKRRHLCASALLSGINRNAYLVVPTKVGIQAFARVWRAFLSGSRPTPGRPSVESRQIQSVWSPGILRSNTLLRHFPRTAMSGREDPSACLVLSLQIGALASQGRRRRRARTPRFPIPAQAGWLLHKARRERNAIYRACYGRAAVRNMLQRQIPNNPLSFIVLRTFLLTNSSSGTTRPNRSHCVDENVRWALEGRLLTYLPEAAGRHHPHASCILAASGLLQVNVPCPVLPSLLPRLNAEPVAR